MRVEEALALGRTYRLDRLDTQLLVAHATGRSRAWLLAHGEAELDAEQGARVTALIGHRVSGEPLAYLVGEKEFHGLRLQVDARVLVPRPDTELLVDWAIELLRGDLGRLARPKVVDLGTGSGAIALAVKHAHPAADIHAVDLSAGALEVARNNATRLGLAVNFAQGTWWQALPGQQFDLALANPPYIAAEDLHLDTLRSEPRAALSPGTTGLEALAEIIDVAATHLTAGAWLLLEHGFDQDADVAGMLSAQGFRGIATRHDLAGHPRCTGASL